MQRPAAAASPSSRGLGHRPFTAVTGVRIPLGTPINIEILVQLWSNIPFMRVLVHGTQAHYSRSRPSNRQTAARRCRLSWTGTVPGTQTRRWATLHEDIRDGTLRHTLAG